MLKIRPATLKDKDIVIDFSKRSWNSNDGEFDYIPLVFDKWVNDKEGQFVIAELNGKPVGCAKLTCLKPNIAWLEGLRVDNTKQGLGIGKALQKHFIDQRENFENVRLSSFIENYASLHIIKKRGFEEKARFTIYEAEVKESLPINFDVKVITDITTVSSYLNKQQLLVSNNFLGFDWVFKPLTNQLLSSLVKNNSVYGVYDNNKLQGLMILSSDHCKETDYCINYLQYNNEKYAKSLLNFAKNKVADLKVNKVVAMCSDIPDMRELFINNNFYSYNKEINNVFAFELKK